MKYLPLPIFVLLTSCTSLIETPTNTGFNSPTGVTSSHRNTIPAPGSGGSVTNGTSTIGAGTAIQTVRGAREAASTFQVFRNLFGAL